MPRYFAQYWTRDVFESHQENVGRPLTCVASKSFYQKGVRPDDIVYAWSFSKNELFLVGRIEVDHICTHAHAEEALGGPIIDKGDVAIAREGTGTLQRFSLVAPLDLIRQIRFQEALATKLVRITPPDKVSQSAFQGFRELTPGTARLLDDFLVNAPEETISANRGDQAATGRARAGGPAAPGPRTTEPVVDDSPPSPAASAPDPLVFAIKMHLPESLQQCSRCQTKMKLMLGPIGFLLECGNRRCSQQESVPHSVLNAALHELKLRCNHCQGPLKSALGKHRYVAACASYPQCKFVVSWVELRRKLRSVGDEGSTG